jgi:DNA-binding transcriptional MerR regulator
VVGMTNEWSIQQIARLAGTTSRTLRHYGEVDLLHPARTAPNGYRYYDGTSLVRLQRILLLRQLGLGLPQIADVLAEPAEEANALESHLEWLRSEQDRLTRQIASVESTIAALNEGEELMAEKMFDGFDHTQHREEVEQRWGADAYAESDRWYRGMDDAERAAWHERQARLAADWNDAFSRGIPADGDEAQAIAERHVAWLRGIPGTPAARGHDVAGYVTGLADMYVADPRFAANYGGSDGAGFVREALHHYARTSL